MQRQVDFPRGREASRTEWTSRVVMGSNEMHVDESTGEKTPVFQMLLNNAFAELSERGYHVTVVQPFQGGCVVFASRVVSVSEFARAEAPAEFETHAVYSWVESGQVHTRTFLSLEEAVRVASSHFEDSDKVPVSVHLSALAIYNRVELKRLVSSCRK